MAFVYVPNGIIMDGWNRTSRGPTCQGCRAHPEAAGAVRQESLRCSQIQAHNTGRALLDGAGDRRRCCRSYLTGVAARKTIIGTQGRGVVRQIVANQVGPRTRASHRSSSAWKTRAGRRLRFRLFLRLHQQSGVKPPDGHCRGVSDPRSLFERLFGNSMALTPEGRARQSATYRRSILDFVTEDTLQLGDGSPRSRPTAQARRNRYLSSIRED